MLDTHCPLCLNSAVSDYHRDTSRQYLQCGRCDLVFVARRYLPSKSTERGEYDKHRNDPADQGYRDFLSRLAVPLMERVPAGASGLDFGCGPGPALVQMLREAGYAVALYDSFYAPDNAVLETSYDFVCATEVVEHLHNPGAELDRIWRLLRPAGWLAVMTKLVRNPEAFAGWHYIRDITHVCFFSEATWFWWAREYGARLEFIGADVILLQRQ